VCDFPVLQVLPTRDLLQGEDVGKIRTNLTITTQDVLHYVSYGDLLALRGHYYVQDNDSNGMPKTEKEARNSFLGSIGVVFRIMIVIPSLSAGGFTA
jgi:hypothetical protein